MSRRQGQHKDVSSNLQSAHYALGITDLQVHGMEDEHTGPYLAGQNVPEA